MKAAFNSVLVGTFVFLNFVVDVSGYNSIPIRTDYVADPNTPICTDAREDLLALNLNGVLMTNKPGATTCEEFVSSQLSRWPCVSSADDTPHARCKAIGEFAVKNNASEIKSFLWINCPKYCGICNEDNGYISDFDRDGISDAEDCYDMDNFGIPINNGDADSDGILDCDSDFDSDGIADLAEKNFPGTASPTKKPSSAPSLSPSFRPSGSPTTLMPSSSPTNKPTKCESWPDLLPLKFKDNGLDAEFKNANKINAHALANQHRQSHVIGLLGQDCKYVMEKTGRVNNATCEGQECCKHANRAFRDAYCASYCDICKKDPTPFPTLMPSFSPSAFPSESPTISPTNVPSQSPTCFTRNDSLKLDFLANKPSNYPDCAFYTKSEALAQQQQCEGRECCQYSDPAFTWFYCPKFCNLCHNDPRYNNDCDGDTIVDVIDCYDTDPLHATAVPGRPCDEDKNSDGTADKCDPTSAPSSAPTSQPTTSTPTLSPSLNPSSNPTLKPTNEPTESPSSSPTISPSKAPTVSPTPCEKMPNRIPMQGKLYDCQYFTYHSARKSLSTEEHEINGKTVSAQNCEGNECCAFSPVAFTLEYCATFCEVCNSDNDAVQDCDSDGIANLHDNQMDCTAPSTSSPSKSPTTKVPSKSPSSAPTNKPSSEPSLSPSTALPTLSPSSSPSSVPDLYYCREKTESPSSKPTAPPSLSPTLFPTVTEAPTGTPTTLQPSSNPSTSPTIVKCKTGQDLLPIDNGPDCEYYTKTDAKFNTKVLMFSGKEITGATCTGKECCSFSDPDMTRIYCSGYCEICLSTVINDCDQDGVSDDFDCWDSDSTVAWRYQKPNEDCDVDSDSDGTSDKCEITDAPTLKPSEAPTDDPTPFPSPLPTFIPSSSPTDVPTVEKTDAPTTSAPTESLAPTSNPTFEPTCRTEPDRLLKEMSCEYYTKSDAALRTRIADDGTILDGSKCVGRDCCEFSDHVMNAFYCATYCNICPTDSPTMSPTTREPTSSPSHSPSLNPSLKPTLDPSSSPTLYPSTSPTSEPTCITFRDLLPIADPQRPNGHTLPGCLFYIQEDAKSKGHQCSGTDCCQFADEQFVSFYCAQTCNICTCDNAYIRDCDDDGISDFLDCYDSDSSLWEKGDKNCDPDMDSDGISDQCECGYTSPPTNSPTSSPTTALPTTSPSSSPTTDSPTFLPTVSPSTSPTCSTNPDVLPLSTAVDRAVRFQFDLAAYILGNGFNFNLEADCNQWIDNEIKGNSIAKNQCHIVSPPHPCTTRFAKEYCASTCGICRDKPTVSPTTKPSLSPSLAPSESPSSNPSKSPTMSPTGSPSVTPTNSPSQIPTGSPSDSPSMNPTLRPSSSPSIAPTTCTPIVSPTAAPSVCETRNDLLDCGLYTFSIAKSQNKDCVGVACCEFGDKEFIMKYCASFCSVCDEDNGVINDCDGDSISDIADCYDSDPTSSIMEDRDSDGIIDPCDSDSDSDGISDTCDNAPFGHNDVVGKGSDSTVPNTDSGSSTSSSSTTTVVPSTTSDLSSTTEPPSTTDDPGSSTDSGSITTSSSTTTVSPSISDDSASSSNTDSEANTSEIPADCKDLLSNFCQFANKNKCTSNQIYHRACAYTCRVSHDVACPSDRRRSVTSLQVALDAQSAECSMVTVTECTMPHIAALCPASCK